MRLLKLPQEVRAEVAGGRLSMGHARALLASPTKAGSARSRAKSSRESVGARDRNDGEAARSSRSRVARARPQATDVHTRAAEERLRMALGTRVRIVRKGKGGRIEIDFTSEDELQRLVRASDVVRALKARLFVV